MAYARLDLSDRVDVWGLAGYGTGGVTLTLRADETRVRDEAYEPDIAMRMCAVQCSRPRRPTGSRWRCTPTRCGCARAPMRCARAGATSRRARPTSRAYGCSWRSHLPRY